LEDDGCFKGKGEERRDTEKGECHKIVPGEFLFEKENAKHYED
jgi:hypothetical protein